MASDIWKAVSYSSFQLGSESSKTKDQPKRGPKDQLLMQLCWCNSLTEPLPRFICPHAAMNHSPPNTVHYLTTEVWFRLGFETCGKNCIYKPHSCQPCSFVSFKIKCKTIMIGRFMFIWDEGMKSECQMSVWSSNRSLHFLTVFECRIQYYCWTAKLSHNKFDYSWQCLHRQETFTK